MDNSLFTLPQNADPQLVRAEVFISSGDFAAAEGCCDKVLDADPKNLHAYLFKIMAKCQIRNAEQLVNVPGLPQLAEFKLARQFAEPALAAKLDELVREQEAFNISRPIREACRIRQDKLRESLTWNLPGDLAAEVQKRIEAEQALMAAPDAAAAEREAAATDELENRIEKVPQILNACRMRQDKLRETLTWNLPGDLAAEVQKRIEAEQSLMRAPAIEAAERETAATDALIAKIPVPTLESRIRKAGGKTLYVIICGVLIWVIVVALCLIIYGLCQ